MIPVQRETLECKDQRDQEAKMEKKEIPDLKVILDLREIKVKQE